MQKEKNINYKQLSQNLLAALPERQKMVLKQRFGLDGSEIKTLESIGRSLGITRERVRQIEAEALKKIKEKNASSLKSLFLMIERRLKDFGGIKKEDLFLSALGDKSCQQDIYFILSLDNRLTRLNGNKKFYPAWMIDVKLLKEAEKVIARLENFFKKKKKPVSKKEFKNLVKEIGGDGNFAFSAIEISKTIEEGPLDSVGLAVWPEINPRRVRDRAYLALKKVGKPLHFVEIASAAGAISGGLVSPQNVYPQTVHNELIKDERFVLVGRGMYALSEWGYKPGRVREIIAQILKESPRPLKKEEVIDKVLAQRFVKENTILVNLQNKNYFKRDKESKYHLA